MSLTKVFKEKIERTARDALTKGLKVSPVIGEPFLLVMTDSEEGRKRKENEESIVDTLMVEGVQFYICTA